MGFLVGIFMGCGRRIKEGGERGWEGGRDEELIVFSVGEGRKKKHTEGGERWGVGEGVIFLFVIFMWCEDFRKWEKKRGKPTSGKR